MKWFNRKGLLFIPSSIFGWLLLVISAAYGLFSFSQIDSHSHSASDTLMNWFFRLFLIAVAYSLIGMLTSKEKH